MAIEAGSLPGDIWTKLKRISEEERRENHMSPAADAAQLWDYLREEARQHPRDAAPLIRIMHRHQNELKEQGVIKEGLPFVRGGELAFTAGKEGSPMPLEEAQELARQTGKLVYPVVDAEGVPQRCLPPSQEGKAKTP